MKIIINLIAFVFIFTSCRTQKPRIEKSIQNCMSEYYPHKVKTAINAISIIEKELNSENIFKSNSRKEYIELLNKIKSKNIKINFTVFNKLDSLHIFEVKHKSEINKCKQNLLSSNKYNNKTYKELQEKFKVLANNKKINSIEISKTLLEKLNKKDFDFVFYKVMALRNLHLYSMEHLEGIKLEIPKGNKIKKSTENSLKLILDNLGEINYGNTIIESGKLEDLISKYISKEKENSKIILSLSLKTKMSFYIKTNKEILTIITELRNNYSIKKYNLEYKVLPEKAKTEIKKIIPMNVEMKLK